MKEVAEACSGRAAAPAQWAESDDGNRVPEFRAGLSSELYFDAAINAADVRTPRYGLPFFALPHSLGASSTATIHW